jgi:hypothetical protein
MQPRQREETSRQGSARFLGVAWFRAGLTGVLWLVTLAALVTGMVCIPQGEFKALAGKFLVLLLGVPLLILSVVSTVIAAALFRGSRRGAMAAILFDAMVGVLLVFLPIAARPIDRTGVAVLSAPFAIALGLEAAWLLVVLRRSPPRADRLA